MILISGLKSLKFAQKIRIFLKFLTLEGTLFASIIFLVIHSFGEKINKIDEG